MLGLSLEERTPRTRAKVRSVWIDFFEWAVRERGLQGNPARALAAPKKRDVPTDTFPPSLVERIIGSQTDPTDIIGTTLILRYGLRRGAIVSAQRRHFDIERRLLTVHTKGGRIYPVPVPEEALWLALGRLELEAQWREDDFLLYHQDTRRMRVDPAEAKEILSIGKEQIGYARVTRRRHDRKPTGKLAHRWCYRCLERAGVVSEEATSGMHMHRGRHTAATELQRSHHDLRLTGHADIRSTARYAQLDTADLAQTLLELQEGKT